ncbi:MAG: peptidoglycan DD-metalloendopeptidase family protein [Inquilinus limosus]|uniref:Peptidoglycan DD-metalloendopeptidase family protein n=1 Tax=Inquilinus limosus TaxID=171674 RepID=A0A952FQ91_9PROT|nr:peptidoglycan DD-metalloendopeptidase family protein [Inquilinus limosus]
MTAGPDTAVAAGPVAGTAGAPHVLARPDLGVWALSVATRADGTAEAAAILADLAALDAGLPQAEAARLIRRRLEQEALRLGHRSRTAQGDEAGVAVIVALTSLPHLLCLRLGAAGLHRLDGARPGPIAFPGPDDAAAEAQPALVDTLRARLEPGTMLALASPSLARALADGSAATAARMPPAVAARFLVQRAAPGDGPPAAIVLAAPLVEINQAPAPALPSHPVSTAAPGRRPGRGIGILAAIATVLVLGAAAAVGLYAWTHREAPPQPAGPGAPVEAPDVAAMAPTMPPAAIAAADRRLAQAARLAVAVSAIEGAFSRLGFETEAPVAARPFAPAALDARATALAARLPDLPLATPLRTEYRMSSPFGFRVHPITGVPTLHAGLDLVAPRGTPIFATGTGRVLRAGVAGGYGNMVEIQHAEGLVTRYGHMDTIAVTEGQAVTAGSVLGTLGSTGDSTGPHVHYEIRRGGQPVDPMPFLEAGQTLKSLLAIALRS